MAENPILLRVSVLPVVGFAGCARGVLVYMTEWVENEVLVFSFIMSLKF